MKKLLIVDDDTELLGILTSFFEDNGFEIVTVNSGEKALVSMKTAKPDLVLLDLDLPGINGYEVIDRIRHEDSCTPIILMTGSWTTPESKIKGYSLGAIQFLEKPVQIAVLLAQVNSLLSKHQHENTYIVGDRLYSLGHLKFTNGIQTADLTQKEFLALKILFENMDTTVPRSLMVKHLWGHDTPHADKLLDNIIYNIRSKMAIFSELIIRNDYGVGYLLIIYGKAE